MEQSISYFCIRLWMVFHSNDVFDKFHGAYFFFVNRENEER